MNIELNIFLPKLKEIREEVLKIYNQDFTYELKEDNSPLTKADFISETILVDTIKKNFPNDVIITEESGILHNDLTKKRVWVIDPLDGTRDFIRKSGDFSVMLGLLDKEKVIFGLVYIPLSDKVYFAIKGNGSYLYEKEEYKKLKVSKILNLNDYTYLRSRNHFSEKDMSFVEKLGFKDSIAMGSIGIKFAFLAEGKGDIVFYSTNNLGIWDCCGPSLIVKESGGDVFDFNGNDLEYDFNSKKMKYGVIATNGKNKKEILRIIKE